MLYSFHLLYFETSQFDNCILLIVINPTRSVASVEAKRMQFPLPNKFNAPMNYTVIKVIIVTEYS